MLLLKLIICSLLKINLSFALEILQTSPEKLPDNLHFRMSTSLSPDQTEQLIESYKKQLYRSDESSHLVPAQALFALFEKTKSPTAIDILADFYYEQIGDTDMGLALYKHGADFKSTHCLFKLARLELASGNNDDALRHLQKGVELFDNYCLCMLAQKILDGTFKDRHHSEAKKCLMISAQQGFTVAITELAKYLTDKKYGQPHYLLAYSLLSAIPDDNRARQQLDILKDNIIIITYLNRDFVTLAEVFYIGKNAPQNSDLAIAFIKASSLTPHAKIRLIKLIKQNKPWKAIK
jgi:tetratricopeptide (TPR) repeat protein